MMNPEEQQIVKASIEVMAKPFTEVMTDLVGVAGGAWLKEQHLRTREKLKDETEKIRERRKIKETIEPSPSVALPLLEAAQIENRDELLSVWARLLVAATDPARAKYYRRQYVEIAKGLEPLDAPILELMAKPTNENQRNRISEALRLSNDQVTISFINLINLGLAAQPKLDEISSGRAHLTALGSEFLKIIQDDP